MRANPSKLLLDSNVWIDLFASDRAGHGDAVKLVTWAVQQEAILFFAASSVKDVYYLLQEGEKRKLRAASVEINAGVAAAVDEYAWGCLGAMEDLGTVVPLDQSDVWLATKFRSIHGDFEDNLVLAAMERSDADYLVTGDKTLLRRCPVPALPAAGLLALVEG